MDTEKTRDSSADHQASSDWKLYIIKISLKISLWAIVAIPIVYALYNLAEKINLVEQITSGFPRNSLKTTTNNVDEACGIRLEAATRDLPAQISAGLITATDRNEKWRTANQEYYDCINSNHGVTVGTTQPAQGNIAPPPAAATPVPTLPEANDIQLDATEEASKLPVTGVAGRTLIIQTGCGSQACYGTGRWCGGPDGSYDPLPDLPAYQMFTLHNGTAKVLALLGRWGEDGPWFLIGSEYKGTIPSFADGKNLWVTHNIEGNNRQFASGGHILKTVKIE